MMVRQWKFCGIVAVLIVAAATTVFADPEVIAQVATETPAVINLASAVPVDQGQAPGAPTLTRTPTPVGGALLEAKEYANVRAEPSTDAAQLGTINAGETYNVIGRYASWIQFQFQSSPTGQGWVYDELVTLSGSTENIPEIDPYTADQQLDTAALGATATQGVLTQTPGGILTATVLSRQGALSGAATATLEGTRGILPTYTYPPGIVAVAPTAGTAVAGLPTDTAGDTAAVQTTNGDGLPPIAPILILGSVGLLGLVVSSLRRR